MAILHPRPEKPLFFYIFSDLSFFSNMACDCKDLKSFKVYVWTFIRIANSNATNTKRFENLKSLRGLHWRLTFWIIQRFPDFSQMNQRWYYSIFNTEKKDTFCKLDKICQWFDNSQIWMNVKWKRCTRPRSLFHEHQEKKIKKFETNDQTWKTWMFWDASRNITFHFQMIYKSCQTLYSFVSKA